MKTLSVAEIKATMPWMSKELSWLSFNERVLQEASDESVPLIQRVRYLGIFSNNLDEFFRVRVADVRRLATYSPPSQRDEYQQLMNDIRAEVVSLQDRFEETYSQIMRELARRKIYLVHEGQLDEKQTTFVRSYFFDHVLPELVPIILSDAYEMPELNENSIYLAVRLSASGSVRYALLEVPTQRLSRFVRIPQKHGKRGKVIIVLENIIRLCLDEVFRGVFSIDDASAYTIKITRDAELELGEEITESFFERISDSLKKRRTADPVRFVYDEEMPQDLLEYLTRRLGIGKLDSHLPGGRYHNSKDFMSFPNLGGGYLEFKPLPVLRVHGISPSTNLFDVIREKDVLLYYPYHSFDHITDLLKTAAIDPAVKQIKVCLYRVASNSHVVDALLSAEANHKDVTAIVELQARFDEAANIDLATRLTDSGVNVIFGVPGLKVHSKLISISRQEGNQLRYYSHIGTGNFNEKTARIYTDFSVLTYDQEIGAEVAKAFEFIQYTYRRHDFQKLIVSPLNSRDKLLEKIHRETRQAKKGLAAGLLFKCNNLVDHDLISALYAADQAGVRVRIIVRGMCSLQAGVKGFSDSIEVISIVDRYLEHPRVYLFENNGAPETYIASADLMTRNIDHRVEVMCPIQDPDHQRTIRNILEIQWADNMKARIMDAEQTNRLRHRKKGGRKIRSQEMIHRYLKTGDMPRLPKLKPSSKAKGRVHQ